MADEGIRIPIEIDTSQGLADLVRFSRQASREIGTIGPGGRLTNGEVRIPIGVDPTNAITNLGKLDTAVKRSQQELVKLSPGANQATQALTNLGRVAQDAPFGFIGIANNLNPLLESFQRLKATTGSSGAALKALGSSLIGAGGLGLALSAITAVVSFASIGFSAWSRGMGSAKREADSFAQSISGAKDEFIKAVTNVSTLRKEIELAKQGFIDKDRVVKEYNSTIGKTTGFVNSLDEAEKQLQKNANAYIQFTLLKAAANVALGKAADQAFKIQEEINKGVSISNTSVDERGKAFAATRKLQDELNEAAKKGDTQRVEELKKQLEEVTTKAARSSVIDPLIVKQDAFSKIGNDLLSQAAKFAKEFHFNFFDDPKLKDKTENIIAKAKEVSAFLKDHSLFKITYEFDPTDNKAAAIRKAQAFLDDVSKGKLKLRTDLFSIPFSEPPKREEFEKQFNLFDDMVQKGLANSPGVEIPVNVIFPESDKLFQDFNSKFKALGFSLTNILGNFDVNKLTADQLDGLLKKFKEIKAAGIEIAQVLTPAFTSMFEAIGSGKNLVQAFFDGLRQSVNELIKRLIAAAIQAAILNALSGGNGKLIGGVGKGIAGAFSGFASGGLVSGPVMSLIGEGRGTSRNNPEVVSPLDQLKSFFSDIITSSLNGRSGGSIAAAPSLNFSFPKSIELFAAGKDLVGVIALETQSQRRGG